MEAQKKQQPKQTCRWPERGIIEAAYGSWRSPITSAVVTSGPSEGVQGMEVQLDLDDPLSEHVYWTDIVDGAGIVFSRVANGDLKRPPTRWTDAAFNCQSSVHEYGGGAFWVSRGRLCFVTPTAIYLQLCPSDTPQLLNTTGLSYRYADGVFCEDKVICIREDHSVVELAGAKEPINTVVSIDIHTKEQLVLAQGADFYAHPRVSRCGRKLTWMQWDHPNMAWDATEIWVAQLDESGQLVEGSERKVLGEGQTNYMNPRWDARGNLFFISDQTNWWNIYRMNVDDIGSSEASQNAINVYPCSIDLGEANWLFGSRVQTFTLPSQSKAGAKIVFACGDSLLLKDLSSGHVETLNTGYSLHHSISFANDGSVYCVARSPAKPQALIRYHLESHEVTKMREYEYSMAIVEKQLSIPRRLKFDSGDSVENFATGYYYPPKNVAYTAPVGTLPPALILAHGGPTAQTSAALDLEKQYFTSRGIAVFDVDYRGSTGQGRQYRDQLKGEWGVMDLEDVCNASRHLTESKLADPRHMCIMGGSAGGYLVLRTLTHPHLFSVGVSNYGICDLEALAADTHKMESRYMDRLVAPYPQGKAVYRQRSPIDHLDEIAVPVAFFQGLADKIVPPEQADMMFHAVRDKGLPTALTYFEGEGHGFQEMKNVQLALDGAYVFICKVLGIDPSVPEDDVAMMNIVNL